MRKKSHHATDCVTLGLAISDGLIYGREKKKKNVIPHYDLYELQSYMISRLFFFCFSGKCATMSDSPSYEWKVRWNFILWNSFGHIEAEIIILNKLQKNLIFITLEKHSPNNWSTNSILQYRPHTWRGKFWLLEIIITRRMYLFLTGRFLAISLNSVCTHQKA